MKAWVFIILISCCQFFAISTAFGDVSIDQVNDFGLNDRDVLWIQNFSWQQGVTAAKEGKVSFIDLKFSDRQWLNESDLSIPWESGTFNLSLSAGAPYQTAPSYKSVVSIKPGWNNFDVRDANLFVHPGESFTIGVTGPQPAVTPTATVGMAFTHDDFGGYQGGVLYMNKDMPFTQYDWAFRTYVDTELSIPTFDQSILLKAPAVKSSILENPPELKIYDGNSFVSPNGLFDASKETFVITHGWNGPLSSVAPENLNDPDLAWVKDMSQEILENKGNNVNVLVLDWTGLANSTTYNPLTLAVDIATSLYSDPVMIGGYYLLANKIKEESNRETDWWVPNNMVDNVSQDLASQLSQLFAQSGVSTPAEINFIGHSLGAAVSAKTVALLESDSLSSNIDVGRLTLLDAPENNPYAYLSGGMVNLESTIDWLSRNALDVVIQNIFGPSTVNPYGGFGKYYSGVFNEQLPLENHEEVRGWYIDTINNDYKPLEQIKVHVGVEIVTIDIPLTSSYDRGFNLDDVYLKDHRGVVEEIGDIVPYGGVFYKDTYKFIESFLAEEIQTYSKKSIDALLYKFSPSGEGQIIATELGDVLITGSPIFGYFEHFVPENAVGFGLDFRPEIWDPSDLFTIWVDGVLIYNLLGKYFTNSWINTGVLDISLWAGHKATFTYGFLSDFSGHELTVGKAAFILQDNGQVPVPEPATMLLFGTGIAGLIAARRRKKKAC